MVAKDDIDESHFSQRPTNPDADSNGPSASSSRSTAQKAHYRPHIPHFPAVTSPRYSNSSIPLDSADNDIHIPKAESVPNSNYPSSYAHLLSRLRNDSQKEGKRSSRSPCGSRSCSNNLNVVLRLLSIETARADAAERRLAKDDEAILTRVRNIREAHARAQAELVRVNTELALYKFQLDLAQQEIRRAQVIIDEADKARAEAEERRTKDREKIRELVLQRAVDDAREEGRREGWRLGLERGRWDARAMQHDRRQLENYDQTETPEETGYRSPRPRLSPTSSSHSLVRQSDTRVAIRTPQSSVLPISCSNSSDRRESKRRSPEYLSLVSRESRRCSSSNHPRSETRSSHPISHRSVNSYHSVPPDGFIPTLGSDQHIVLPPYGLGVPVDLAESGGVFKITGAQTWLTTTTGVKDKGIESRHTSVARDASSSQEHTHNWSSTPIDQLDHAGYETPALSAMSKRSTRISEFDIVRPPTVEALGNHEYLSHAKERDQQPIILHASCSGTRVDNSEEILEERHFVLAGDLLNNQETVGATASQENPYEASNPRIAGGPRLFSSVSQVLGSDLARRASYIYRTNDRHQLESQPSDEVARTRSTVNIYHQPILPISGSGTSSSESRATVQRSTSETMVPGIDVEPPSHSPTNTSPETTVNPALLTPEHANYLTVVPEPLQLPQSSSAVSDNSLDQPVFVEQLPPGFVCTLMPYSHHRGLQVR
ncbi:hypothetical protein H2248_010227 [Termitomyces sp. 'cryptogamus']|nr:hypothetical protein H2248_010227 [Termitomyces sp. 'cryptogamus']